MHFVLYCDLTQLGMSCIASCADCCVDRDGPDGNRFPEVFQLDSDHGSGVQAGFYCTPDEAHCSTACCAAQVLYNAAPLPSSVVCGRAAISQVGQRDLVQTLSFPFQFLCYDNRILYHRTASCTALAATSLSQTRPKTAPTATAKAAYSYASG
jgi:hypothetical protein